MTNKQVTIVEDVVTSGGQIVLSALNMRDIGAVIDHAICVIDRQQGGAQHLEEHKIRLGSLFLAEDLERGQSERSKKERLVIFWSRG